MFTESIDRYAYAALLYDFYGSLLTKKQSRVIEMHFLNDLSLSEIGEELIITRQAAGILINRSVKILENYESKLGLVKKHIENEKRNEEIISLLREIAETESISSDNKAKIDAIIKYISEEL